MTVLLESLRVLTTCSSVLLNVSPWPEFARINRQRTPGPLTVLPVVMLFCNSFLWTIAAQVALYFTYCNTDESRQEEAQIQAAAAALENATKVMGSAGSYGSLNSFVPHTYHSVVDVHEKNPLPVAAAN
ncbi:hypothetical protein PRIC2_004657 [Phytophthora ramorum]